MAREAGNRARRRRRLASAGVVLAALVLAFGGREGWRQLRRSAEARERREALGRAAQAFADLEACLLGERLGQGDEAGERYRAIELAARRAPGPASMGSDEASWPGRCAAGAESVARELEAVGGLGGAGEAARAARGLAAAKMMPEGAFGYWIEALFDEGRALFPGLPEPRPGIPPPPRPASPLRYATLAGVPDELRWLGPRLGEELRDPPHVAFDAGDGVPVVCRVAKEGGRSASSLACVLYKHLPHANVMRVGGADEGIAPPVYSPYGAGRRADSGKLFAGDRVRGAYAGSDGSLTWLAYRPRPGPLPGLTVLEREAPGAAPSSEILAEPAGGQLHLLGGILFELRPKRDAFELSARSLEGPRSGPPVVVGELPGGVAPVRVCRTPEALALLASGKSGVFLALRAGQAWSAPRRVAPGHALTCRGTEATLTGIAREGGAVVVRQTRCTPAGCASKGVPFEALRGGVAAPLAPASKGSELDALLETMQGSHERAFTDVDAVDLEGKLLVVWADAPEAGLRARVAPIDAIASADDVVLFDPFFNDFRAGSLDRVEIVPSRDAAAVFVSSFTKRFALRVDASGAFGELPVVLERRVVDP